MTKGKRKLDTSKMEMGICIEADQLKIDEILFDVSQTKPFFITPCAKIERQITVIIPGDYLEFFKSSLSLSIDIKEAETEKWLEGYEFAAQVY
ncbi:hypothetical protein [Planococcus halocryophilus]|uniref:hypothetical protein n=1 Tax=Planococcus halocryophilus TaxID=1215089 RepID=UPI00197B79C2|nr:hypothetical protein [Planococcus halocryophilus]